MKWSYVIICLAASMSYAAPVADDYEALIDIKDPHVRTGAFFETAKSASDEELAAYLRHIVQLETDSNLRNTGRDAAQWARTTDQRRRGQAEIFITEMVQRSPQQAMELAQSVEGLYWRQQLIRMTVEHWAHVDTEAALLAVEEALSDEEAQREQLRRTIAYAIREYAPMRGWEILKADGLGKLNEHQLGEFLTRVAVKDPEFAEREAQLIPNEDFRHQVQRRLDSIKLLVGAESPAEQLQRWAETSRDDAQMRQIIRTWVMTDPVACASYLNSLDAGINWKWSALELAFGEWSRKQTTEAFRWLQAHGDSERYQRIIYENLPSLIAKDYALAQTFLSEEEIPQTYESSIYQALVDRQEATSFAKKCAIIRTIAPERVQGSLIRSAVRYWAEHDLKATAQHALTLEDQETQRQVFFHIFNAYAEEDIEEGIAFFRAVPESIMLSANKLIQNYARKSPEKAAELVLELPSDKQYNYADEVAQSYAKANPQQALAWAMSLENASAKNMAIKIILQDTAKVSPATTAALLSQMEAAGMDSEPHWNKLLEQWVDKPAAGDWLRSQGVTENTPKHVSRLLSSWQYDAPEQCLEWLASLPMGEFRDIAYAEYANHMLMRDPPAALPAAVKIDAVTARKRAIERIIKRMPAEHLAELKRQARALQINAAEQRSYLEQIDDKIRRNR